MELDEKRNSQDIIVRKVVLNAKKLRAMAGRGFLVQAPEHSSLSILRDNQLFLSVEGTSRPEQANACAIRSRLWKRRTKGRFAHTHSHPNNNNNTHTRITQYSHMTEQTPPSAFQEDWMRWRE